MILDAHAHLWRRRRTPQPWIDPATMAAINRDFWLTELADQQHRSGVARTVLVQSSNSTAETIDLLHAAATSDTIAGVVGWVDLTAPVSTAIRNLTEAAGGDHLLGIRHLVHQESDPDWLTRPSVGRGLEELAELGLPFDLVVRPDQLRLTERVVAAHPSTSFVLDHLGKPPIKAGGIDEWRRDLSALARHTNVTAKLSGLVLESDWRDWTAAQLRPIVNAAFDLFGPDRLMYGSDWPLVELAGGTSKWMDTALELVLESAHPAVFAGTAQAIYRSDMADA